MGPTRQRMQRVYVWIGGVILVGGVLASIATRPGAGKAATTPARTVTLANAPALPGCIAISGERGTGDDTITITGTATNNCGRAFRYVELRYRTFDRAGATVDTAMSNIGGLQPGETWKFSAWARRGDSFKIDSVAAH